MNRPRIFTFPVNLISLFLLMFCATPFMAQIDALPYRAALPIRSGGICSDCGLLPFSAKFDSPRIIYVESEGAPDQPSQERVETSLRRLQKEIGVEGKPLPVVVVIHIARREAAHAGLADVSVKLRLNNDSEKPAEPYYELWLVGTPSAFEYTLALNSLLEHYFDFHHEEADQERAVERVSRYLEATTSAVQIDPGEK